MAKRNKEAFYTKLDPDLREAMQRYKAAVGVPEAVQVDRALREWLAERSEAWPLPGSAQAVATRKPKVGKTRRQS